MDDLYGPVSTHDRKPGSWPSDVVVASDVLGGHDVVSPAVGLAGDDSEFGDSSLGVGVEQFGTVPDDAPPLLAGPREESRYVDKSQDWYVEGVAEADEPSGLDRGIDVEATGKHLRLIGHDSDGVPAQSAEADDYVVREVCLNFKEGAVVEHLLDGSDDIVRVTGVLRHQRVQNITEPVMRIRGRSDRSPLQIVGRHQPY